MQRMLDEPEMEWVLCIVRWYNTEHRQSRLNFLTPDQRHKGVAEQIFENRYQVYEVAKARHPQRWSDKRETGVWRTTFG